MANKSLDTAQRTFATPIGKTGLYAYRNGHLGGVTLMPVSLNNAGEDSEKRMLVLRDNERPI